MIRIRLERHPYIRTRLELFAVEIGSNDANDGVWHAPERHALPDDIRVRAEATDPEPIAEYGNSRSVRTVFVDAECPSRDHGCPE